ncbi:MAG TPA: cytochrome ubiquinol oxidase subunit I [Anaeromyxobacteraceae bacterium]|nr:cytochrome ubiquinol oxidase subunit I [Anaeromyxobacteraceae bacterium]
MDALALARLQFAVTVGFHFIFPPISIGLAWMVVVAEYLGWKKADADYVRLGKFLGKLLAITFAVGVATGIVMEFQFGTNWSRYSTFVGDIFGAPLAAEGVFAFFLESTFMGLYLFGRERLSKGMHWFSALMVGVGSTLSAFWIIVANSWQQTPAGFHVVDLPGGGQRAELTSFAAAVFNPSTLPRYFHVVTAALVTGAFIVAGVCAWHVRRDDKLAFARKGLKLGVAWGLAFAILEVMPFGHLHAQQVARTQPAKFAAIEGLYASAPGNAPLLLFGVPFMKGPPPSPGMAAPLEIPGLLSWMAFGDFNAPVKSLQDFPEDERPPLWLTFVSFHNMVLLGVWFVAIMALAAWRLYGGRLHESRGVLKALVISIPLPVLACQLGWVAAEVGRQPFIVYPGLQADGSPFQGLRTAVAHSPSVGAGEIAFSLLLFGAVYLALFVLWLFLMVRKTRLAGEPAPA